MSRLAIFGVGGFGREVYSAACGQWLAERPERQIVFVADDAEGEVLGLPVITPSELTREDEIILAVADPHDRQQVVERLDGYNIIGLRTPSSIFGPGVKIGPGAIFMQFSGISTSCVVGAHFHCNAYAYVGHDCVLGDYVTFSPRVSCNGHVEIGDHVAIGTGAILRPGRPGKPLRIGAGAVIGMGAVVTKDVPAGATVVGNPARPIGG